MSSSEREASESVADRIRRNDKSLTKVRIDDWSDAVEILDALKNNTVVKCVNVEFRLAQPIKELCVKLSEVMKCNKSVESFSICLDREIPCERLFDTMATSGGWSSLRELVLTDSEHLSLRELEHLSSFMIQSENLRALSLKVTGDETVPIMDTLLARTKVESLEIRFRDPSTLQNGGRRIATALERCTCITELRLRFRAYNDHVEFFQLLLVGSIPKMVGLKKLELQMSSSSHFDQAMFDMLGQCIGGHQGEIEELRLTFIVRPSVNLSSIVGLAPALRRLKVIRFHGYFAFLTLQQIGELSDVVEDCDALEEFDYSFKFMSIEEFKAICQLLSKFPSLKRVTQGDMDNTVGVSVNLHRRKSRFVAFLEMIKTSKTIEQVPSIRCRKAEKKAAIKQHCHVNMMHNQIELIRKKGLLAATVPSCAWPLILKEFSDMSDVLYYLLQQKHGAMIGPTCHGGKRKQDFD
jgi:hypothetical protein